MKNSSKVATALYNYDKAVFKHVELSNSTPSTVKLLSEANLKKIEYNLYKLLIENGWQERMLYEGELSVLALYAPHIKLPPQDKYTAKVHDHMMLITDSEYCCFLSPQEEKHVKGD